MIPPRQFLREVCISGAEEEVVREHCSGIVGDLTPRLKADKWGHEPLGTAFPEVCRDRSPVVRKRRPEEQSICRVGPCILPGLRVDGPKGVAGIYSHFVGVQFEASVIWKPVRKTCVASWDFPTVPSLRKKALKSMGLSMDSEGVGLRGRLVAHRFCSDLFSAKQDKAVF